MRQTYPSIPEKEARSSIDEHIAKHYRELLTKALFVPLDTAAAERQARAAAAVLFQAGLHRHKLALLRDIMESWQARGASSDPPPVFFEDVRLLAAPGLLEVEAERYYRLALAILPKFAEARYNLAVLYRRAGKLEDALQFFNTVPRMPPHPRGTPHAHLSANAQWQIASIHRMRGNHGAAANAYDRALARLDNFGVDHLALAAFLRQRGRISEAAMHYERIMPYSHLYAAEFVEPDFDDSERLPRNNFAGYLWDPIAETPLEGRNAADRIVYCWHLYLRIPKDAGSASGKSLMLSALTRRPFLGALWRGPNHRPRKLAAVVSLTELDRDGHS